MYQAKMGLFTNRALCPKCVDYYWEKSPVEDYQIFVLSGDTGEILTDEGRRWYDTGGEKYLALIQVGKTFQHQLAGAGRKNCSHRD